MDRLRVASDLSGDEERGWKVVVKSKKFVLARKGGKVRAYDADGYQLFGMQEFRNVEDAEAELSTTKFWTDADRLRTRRAGIHRQRVARELVRLARELVGASEPPLPDGVDESAWAGWVDSLWPRIEKALKRAGVKITGFNPGDAFYDYLEVEYKGWDFTIGLARIESPTKVKQVESFLRNLDDAEALAKELAEGRSDIFYSDIHRAVKRVFKTKEGADDAYSFIADYLRKKGVRVMS